MNKAMLLLATIFMSSSIAVSAASLPAISIGTVETFLDDSGYFGQYKELFPEIDFSGEWRHTAIAYESGNENTVSLSNNSDETFSTFSDSNFGAWESVNFDSQNLFFEDSDPINIQLDIFNAPSSSYFRIFELLEDSKLLSYLGTNELILAKGTLIVGFNDNGLGLGDGDFDDIIVALQPVPVPAALFLFAPALLGFLGLRRKSKQTIA